MIDRFLWLVDSCNLLKSSFDSSSLSVDDSSWRVIALARLGLSVEQLEL